MAYYSPGNEPEDLKNVLYFFLRGLSSQFPGKKIIESQWDHEKYDKTVSYLSKALGYQNNSDFLKAYGYNSCFEESQKQFGNDINPSRNSPAGQSSVHTVPPENTTNIPIHKTGLVKGICTQCGATLTLDSSKEAAICEYCGTPFIVEKAINNYQIKHATIEHADTINVMKKGAVESTLNFVDKQIDRVQDVIGNERARYEEASRRKQEELALRRKRNRPFVIAFWIFILICLAASFLFTEYKNIGKIVVPDSSSMLCGKSYELVYQQFINAGFTNVQLREITERTPGLFQTYGDVDEILVNTDTSFSDYAKYYPNVPVVVSYYPYKEKNQAQHSSSGDVNLVSTPTPWDTGTGFVISETTPEPTPEPAPSPKPTPKPTLTVENNEMLAQVLSSQGDYQLYSNFASQYSGYTIEFDGSVDLIEPASEGGYVCDFLLSAGPYSEDTQIGPTFKFDDIFVFKIKYKGNSPEYTSVGDNVKITAKVESFNANTGLFFLDPISLTY